MLHELNRELNQRIDNTEKELEMKNHEQLENLKYEEIESFLIKIENLERRNQFLVEKCQQYEHKLEEN